VVEWLTLLLVFGRPQVQILAQRPAILTEVFVHSLSSSSECWDSTLQLGNDCFLSTHHSFIGHYIVLVTEKSSLNKLQIKNTCKNLKSQTHNHVFRVQELYGPVTSEVVSGFGDF
jgi:hypothetical protein